MGGDAVTKRGAEDEESVGLLESDWNSTYHLAGEWVSPGNRSAIKDQDPCVEKLAAQVTSATAEDDVAGAFDVAARGEDDRICQTPQKPTQPFVEVIDIIIPAYSREIGLLLAAESRSIVSKARIGIEPATVPMMREASSFPFTAFGESMTSVIPGRENSVKKRLPAGIVAVISPWH